MVNAVVTEANRQREIDLADRAVASTESANGVQH
jgi:hypothetical protein